MFWMRNKENNFPIPTLIWKPAQVSLQSVFYLTILQVFCGLKFPSHTHYFYERSLHNVWGITEFRLYPYIDHSHQHLCLDEKINHVDYVCMSSIHSFTFMQIAFILFADAISFYMLF